jgi:hypothetical protein
MQLHLEALLEVVGDDVSTIVIAINLSFAVVQLSSLCSYLVLRVLYWSDSADDVRRQYSSIYSSLISQDFGGNPFRSRF